MPPGAEDSVLGSFSERSAIVVHGASRGIGLGFARKLVASGRSGPMFFTCRDPESALQLGEMRSACHGSVYVLQMDATQESTVASAASFVRERTEFVDIVINCFGVLHDGAGLRPEKRIADVSAESFARSFSTNAVGPALVAKHFTPLLPKRGRCVLASLSAGVGSIEDNRLGGWYAYRASKAAQNMITRGLSIEIARTKKGAICVALHPGTTATALSEPFTRNVSEDRLFSTERAADQLLAVIDGLQSTDNGRFLAWDGTAIPW
jgi:NAD(P)-dependent dehydrogenase (short-subunit alcohol dehydrogenase family)